MSNRGKAAVRAMAAMVALAAAGCAGTPVGDFTQLEKRALEQAKQREAAADTFKDPASGMVRRPASPARSPALSPVPLTVADDGSAAKADPKVEAKAEEKADPKADPNPKMREPISSAELMRLDTDGPMLAGMPTVRLRLQDCIAKAIASSHEIKIAGFIPAIRATEILEAEGAFDPIAFLRGDNVDPATGFQGVLYRNLDQPFGGIVGIGGGSSGSSRTAGGTGSSGSTTGTRGGQAGIQQLEQQDVAMRFGFRQLLPTGAQMQISQRFGYLESNLVALSPQGTSSMSVSIVQPLLRGAGLDVNRAGIHVAVNNKSIGTEEFRRLVIIRLAEVERAYWNLVRARAALAIKLRLLELQTETARWLKERERDVLPYVRDRALAAVALAEADIVRAKQVVRDAQDRLKVLMNDPALSLKIEMEILPADPLMEGVMPTDGPVREASLRAALDNRPEIRQARLDLKNAAIREGVSRNDLLPALNLMVATVPQGLSGGVGNAFNDQWKWDFQDWLFGISFEVPLGNRTARARFHRSRLNREQLVEQLSKTVQNTYFEVSTALRELESTQIEIAARRRALGAAADELSARQVQLFRGNPPGGVPTALEFLLTSQERHAAAWQSLVDAQTGYSNGVVGLEQSKGTLLYYNNVAVQEDIHRNKTPELVYEPADVLPAEGKPRAR